MLQLQAHSLKLVVLLVELSLEPPLLVLVSRLDGQVALDGRAPDGLVEHVRGEAELR